MAVLDIANQRFGRLVAVRFAGISEDHQGALWLCRCDCGKEKIVKTQALRSGGTRSCGCYHDEVSSNRERTHGLTKSPEYYTYYNAKARCEHPNFWAYGFYGGRGIKFLFKSFEEFYAELGPRPSSKYSLDRIDNDGNYEPGNCRWATKEQQTKNKRPRKDRKLHRVPAEASNAKSAQECGELPRRLKSESVIPITTLSPSEIHS